MDFSKQIQKAEEALSEVDTRLSDPALYEDASADVDGVVARRAELADEVAALYARWEALEELGSAGG